MRKRSEIKQDFEERDNGTFFKSDLTEVLEVLLDIRVLLFRLNKP